MVARHSKSAGSFFSIFVTITKLSWKVVIDKYQLTKLSSYEHQFMYLSVTVCASPIRPSNKHHFRVMTNCSLGPHTLNLWHNLWQYSLN